MDLNVLDWIAVVLVIIGSVNLGLGALGLDIINMIIGSVPILVTILYILVGLSGLYMIYLIRK